MRRTDTGTTIASVAATLIFAVCGGCKTQEKKSEPASTVVVGNQADGIHWKTAQAEFLLTPNGNLLAHLKSETRWLTLDESGQDSGVFVTSGKQLVNDFVRDLGNAQIQPANVKLGVLGKRVDIKGHSASTGLD